MSAAQRIHVRVPFRRPIETAAGPWTYRDSWIVRHRAGGETPALGEGPSREEAIATHWPAELAGRSVPVNALIGGGPLDAVVAQARDAVAAGFGTIKMKVGTERSIGDLRDRVRVVREAIGRDVGLRLDANGAWSPEGAPERMRCVWDFDVEFVEQPIPASAGAAALAQVRAESPVQVAADESVVSIETAGDLLAVEAVDVLIVKPFRVGGPFVAREIVELARAAGVPVVVSTMFETGVGLSVALALAATLPEGPAHGLASAGLLASDLLVRPLEIRDGRMFVPEAVELDERALDRYTVERRGEWS
jgi:L-Ala-D/L-Glu epimerase